MTDPQFQTPPLPPQAPSFTPPPAAPTATPATAPTTVGGTATASDSADDFATKLKLPKTIYKTKIMVAIWGGLFICGILMGAMMFGGGGSSRAPAPSGLQGVIRNPDIQEPLQRCGMVPESYPCIVYLFNHTRNDRVASTFFNDAIKLTGRQLFLVQIENKQYTNTRIPPGHIAQIKIPPLR